MQYNRLYDFQAGQTAVADQVDAEFNTIAGILNGNVDATNLKDGAVTSGKIQDGTIVQSDLETNLQEGWTAFPAAVSFGSDDSPTFTITEAGDITHKVYPGSRVKLQQSQALSYYWKLEDNTASVGSPTMANIGSPTYTAGKFNNALTLNGTNQALSITDHSDFKPTGEFTLGCWFKTSNTGVGKVIFQSFSDNTNANGIYLNVEATNVIGIGVGNNAASPSTLLLGNTIVTDGNWHYVIWSYRNNFSQIYLDGRLEASGYTVTPTYAATNYVRIGCYNVTGSNSLWFNGQIDDLFFINGYALDEQTIKAKYNATEEQGTSALTLTKYFLCTASSYSAPNTTVTLYGGTDHSLVNSAISNVYYSAIKAPYGFPLKEEKWTVYRDAIGTQANPVQNTYYNLGSVSIIVPIGTWKLAFDTTATIVTTSTVKPLYGYMGLSKANDSFTEANLYTLFAIDTGYQVSCPLSVSESITRETKVTYYLVSRTISANVTSLQSGGVKIIRATSTLL